MRLESWQNAQEQGIAAARSALGTEVNHQPLPWFWSDQYDVNLQILGDIPAGVAPVVRGDLAARRASLFFFDGDALRGVIAINATRDLKVAKKWMSQGRAVDIAAIADTAKALA